MRTYRVAILGCRGRGTAAARAYHAHPRTKVVAICDLLRERLDTLGDELDVSARYTDLDVMIEGSSPDIVTISTGTEFHFDLSMRVLEHGLNIEVEKPLCTDLQQVDALLDRASEKGVRVAVHHQSRVGPSLTAMSRAVAQGRIGKLRYICATGKGYYGGYGLMNIGTHLLTYLMKFSGRCRSVVATALTDGRPITPHDVVASPSGMGTIAGEHITATLSFDDNVKANLLHHRYPVVDGDAYGLELYGTEGRLTWREGAAWWLPNPHYVPDGERGLWQPLELEYPDHYDPTDGADADDYSFVNEYVRALDEGREHESSGDEGRHVIEIMMGIFESAAYGRPVDLPQKRRDHPLLRWRREHDLGDAKLLPRPYYEWLAAEDRRLGRGAGTDATPLN